MEYRKSQVKNWAALESHGNFSKGSAFQAMKASLTLGKITAHPKSGKILATSCNKFIEIPTALFGPRPMRQKLSLWEDAYKWEKGFVDARIQWRLEIGDPTATSSALTRRAADGEWKTIGCGLPWIPWVPIYLNITSYRNHAISYQALLLDISLRGHTCPPPVDTRQFQGNRDSTSSISLRIRRANLQLSPAERLANLFWRVK